MTAREQIAEVLNDVGLGCPEFDPNDPDSGCPDCGDLLRYADALVPLVDRLCAEAAADELEKAADWLWDDGGPSATAYHYLTDRAEALRDGGAE